MLQNDELAKVKARIRALANKTVSRGCSEHEAMMAAEMVGKLLETYNLSMSEVDIRETPCVQRTVDTGSKRLPPIRSCISAIAAFCDCKVWMTKVTSKDGTWVRIRKGRNKGKRIFRHKVLNHNYNFFGHAPDVDMALYLYDLVNKAVATELRKFKKTTVYVRSSTKAASSSSFQNGMVQRIAERLTQMKDKRDAEMAALRSTGTSLMVIKNQLIEQEYEKLTEELGLKTVYLRNKTKDMAAYEAGEDAAEQVNLSRPLEADAFAPLLLPAA